MIKQDLTTGSGLWALWDYDTYKEVDSYQKWEPLFCDDADIEAQIRRKRFVPVNIHQDGCFSFTLKIAEELSDREQKYVCVKSEPYLFQSNGKLILSGLDSIHKDINSSDAIIVDIENGFYSVQVYLISWDEEPGAYLDDGDINPDALSDFVVLVKPNADPTGVYRERVNTFSEDD